LLHTAVYPLIGGGINHLIEFGNPEWLSYIFI